VNLRLRPALLACVTAGSLLALLSAPIVAAHTHVDVGEFHLEVGWLNEPALVGQPNAVQLTIANHDESPVTDLGADDLKVVVSTAGQDSDALALTPAFDAEEGEGPLGEYHAALVPTAPGDYSFHFTGSIHGTAVDVTLKSGPETFDSVEGTSDLEFPVKQPTLTEVGTRLDRIDGRIEALRSAAPAAGALASAQDTATGASAAADRALLIGALLGGAGLVVAVIALALVLRVRRPGAGTA
jgi:hypothetical protein